MNSQAETGDEGPDTPAPLFAIRAFKQALFGTPAPASAPASKSVKRPQSMPKLSENQHESRPENPKRSARLGAKSTEYQAAESRPALDTVQPFTPSKKPGILLTPGTGGAKRKSVSFDGKQNEQNAPNQNISLPGRASFSKTAAGLQQEDSNSEDVTRDLRDPRSISGRYWKAEYDTFSQKSDLEIKKLLKKEQVAKQYAKQKDSAASTLANDLRREQKHVERLEKKVTEYQRKLAQKVQSNGKEHNAVKMRSESKDENKEFLTPERLSLEAENHALKISLKKAKEDKQYLHRLSLEKVARLRAENKTIRAELEHLRASHAESGVIRTKTDEECVSDIWANAVEITSSRRTPQKKASDNNLALAPRNDNPTVNKAELGLADIPAKSLISRNDVNSERKENVTTLTPLDSRKEAAKRRIEARRRTKELA